VGDPVPCIVIVVLWQVASLHGQGHNPTFGHRCLSGHDGCEDRRPFITNPAAAATAVAIPAIVRAGPSGDVLGVRHTCCVVPFFVELHHIPLDHGLAVDQVAAGRKGARPHRSGG
jgi:hypothetical protein